MKSIRKPRSLRRPDLEENNSTILKEYKNSRPTLYVHQLGPITGSPLRTFKNRYQAAKWLLSNKIIPHAFERGFGYTRASITGALTVALQKGRMFAGYLWEVSMENNNPLTSANESVDFIKVKTSSGEHIRNVETLEQAERITKVKQKLIRRNLLGKSAFVLSPKYKQIVFEKSDLAGIEQEATGPVKVEQCDLTGKVVKVYDSVAQAAQAFNVDTRTIRRAFNGEGSLCHQFKFKRVIE